MRNQLANEILMIIRDGQQEDITKAKITILLDKYDIQERTTEVAVYEGDINEQWLRRFLIAKTVKGCTKRTIKHYGNTIKIILGKIGKPVNEITADDVRYYIAIRKVQSKISQTTVKNEIRCLSTFFTWLQAEEMIQRNPMLKIEPLKKEKIKKEAFKEMDIEKMRAVLTTNREKALFEVLYSTWARIFEIVNIKIEDIEESGRIKVFGKGQKERYVYLNSRAQLAVMEYLKERKDKNPYLFPGGYAMDELGAEARAERNKRARAKDWYKYPKFVHPTRQLEISSAETVVRKWGKNAKVEKAHPHRFRRSGATFALRRGMPIEQVSKLLGHESIETTQIYLDIKEGEIKQAHEKWVI